jgi:hypothetical protein
VKDETTGTEFKSAEQTNGAIEHNAGPSSLNFPLMSEAGKKMAAHTAPTSAMDGKINRHSGNPLHDAMLPIFKR